ncbi:MAG: hypothetical protein HY063_09345 [Bacteroidetes bacterium]|nr:hypothetical protein [Bacteroidota bacterium]
MDLNTEKKVAYKKPVRLKKQVKRLIFEAMKQKGKRPCDIVHNTSHHAGYVSKSLKKESNYRLDTTENIFNALGFDVEITMKAIPDALKKPVNK